MKINFEQLTLKNFKNHQNFKMSFYNRTNIIGGNAQGKTTIKDAAAWVLYGTDANGGKLDPLPKTYEADQTEATLEVTVDEKTMTLKRISNGKKFDFYIDDVPEKATAFNERVSSLAAKDVLLTLYNPEYFFSLHWEKQRASLLEFVRPPANSEVFKKMSKAAGETLGKLVKKHSTETLEKMHRDNKIKTDKTYIAAKSKTKTLQEQSANFGSLIPVDSLQTEVAQLNKKQSELHERWKGAAAQNKELHDINHQINNLTYLIESGKKSHATIKNREVKGECFECGQALQGEAIEKMEQSKAAKLESVASEINPLISERKNLRARLATMQFVEIPNDVHAETVKIQQDISAVNADLAKHEQLKALEKSVEEASMEEEKQRNSLNESIYILDAIKEFKAVESEMQAKKIESLFENLSIKLFEEVKTTGELKPTFEIKMNGKEYRRLSLSEKIRAGLELRNVISEQSEIVFPVFVDNAESITDITQPEDGQMITATVVKGQKLEVVEGETE